MTDADDNGPAAITLTVRERVERAPYTHLTGFVHAAPFAGALPDGWSMTANYGGSLDDGSEIEVIAPLLVAPTHNLTPGVPYAVEIPVPVDDIVALRFGSLTNRAWVEREGEYLWLVDHGQTPRLDTWLTQMGTDPIVRRVERRTDGPLRLVSVEEIPLSELQRRQAE